MPFNYIETDDAIHASGVRMVVASGVPSPWTEAAKGILHVKGIPWQAVRLNPRDKALCEWAGAHNAPAVVYNEDAPVNSWEDILRLAEKIAPEPSLLPLDETLRSLAIELSNDICGQYGLGWYRRLNAIHLGIIEQGGFSKPMAEYLAPKYGYTPKEGELSTARVISILGKLSDQLQKQLDAGSTFILGERLSCVDIYSATFCALGHPLPEDVCAMRADMRAVFEDSNPKTKAALSPIILEHRDRIYRDYLELPLSL